MQVIFALILRETVVRGGKQSLGFLWVILEPLAYVSVTIGIYLMTGRKAHSGLPLIPFFISGFMPFLAFRNTALRVMQAAVNNTAIMIYPQIKVLDIIIARTLLEGMISTVVTAILVGVMVLFGAGDPPSNPLGFIAMIWFAVFVGMSLGATLSVMNQFSRETEKIFRPGLRLTMFFSGVFFLADDLPARLQGIATYNPIFHIIQAAREYFFVNLRDHSDILFVFLCALPLLFFGLSVERAASRRSTLE
jgi:capsular polysaccharide transport system permease protein